MDERIWTDRPLGTAETLERDGVTVQRGQAPAAAYLISGDLEKGLARLCPDVPVLGRFGDSSGQATYAIRTGRFTAFVVADAPLTDALGWHTDGFGISDARDIYHAFDVIGERAVDLLSEGGVIVDDGASPSAAGLFAGINVLITGQADGYRLWVPQAYATYITSFLRQP